ncbi:hypothetical protein TNCV_1094251 [Trichonephila clavipes]|uniref:Uncharacterized protein n=1 Tax=Trichonephila clavipes TaxID=2585209 RepID=A0A8X6RF40_TRICX|nr:hypothetical protein TNCV_1094251 [Trichonephila clavipes]
MSAGTGEYFSSLQFHAEIVEVEIGGVAIYRPFGEFGRAKSYCHLYGAQGRTTGVLLTPCHEEFRGSRSDYVRQQTIQMVSSIVDLHQKGKEDDDSLFFGRRVTRCVEVLPTIPHSVLDTSAVDKPG